MLHATLAACDLAAIVHTLCQVLLVLCVTIVICLLLQCIRPTLQCEQRMLPTCSTNCLTTQT